MAGDVCLAVDLGTGGPKVGLVGFDGVVAAQELHTVTTHFGTDGSATQDAREWWELIRESAKRLLAQHPDVAARVAAVAVTGQWASTVPVDADGIPTGPCITWQDTRGGLLVRERIGGRVSGYNARHIYRWVRTTAGAPSLSGADPIGHYLAFPVVHPELIESTRWFLEPVDYLTMQFCGDVSATHASMQAAWLTDTRRLDHYGYDHALLDVLGISDEKLPPLRPIGSIIGNVRASVAKELGMRDDVVVITGLPDLHSAALGAGATSLYATHLALSTTSWISCPVPGKKTDISHSIATVPGLTNDTYLVVNNQETGAKSLEWFRAVLAGGSTTLSYDEITALASQAPAGSRGARFTPWLAGERSPVENHKVRGGFSNLSITSGAAEMARAVMEGVAANSRWLFGYVEKFCGRDLSPVRIIGGGARSDLWCQIYADTLDRPVEQVPDPMFAQLRGMATMASIALGARRLEDVDRDRPQGRVFDPQPESVEAMARVCAALPNQFRLSVKSS